MDSDSDFIIIIAKGLKVKMLYRRRELNAIVQYNRKQWSAMQCQASCRDW